MTHQEKFDSLDCKRDFWRKANIKNKTMLSKRIQENSTLKKRVSFDERNVTRTEHICTKYATCVARCKHGYPHSQKPDCFEGCDDGTGEIIICQRI